MNKPKIFIAAALALGVTSSVTAQQQSPAPLPQAPNMSFFVSSVGSDNGGNFGGLAGADAHCQALAKAAGSTSTNWAAYLSNSLPGSGDPGNVHDVLTGSDPQGIFSTAGGDTTCGNWTKSSDGSAIVGHVDRKGLGNPAHVVLELCARFARMQSRPTEGFRRRWPDLLLPDQLIPAAFYSLPASRLRSARGSSDADDPHPRTNQGQRPAIRFAGMAPSG